jgi:hypothetical protein
MFRLDSDPRVTRYVGNGKPTPRPRSTRARAHHPQLRPLSRSGSWYATRRDTGAFVGWYTLKYIADLRRGSATAVATRGAGLAPKAPPSLFVALTTSVSRASWRHRDNQVSQRVRSEAGLADRGWGRYYGMRLRLFAADRPR